MGGGGLLKLTFKEKSRIFLLPESHDIDHRFRCPPLPTRQLPIKLILLQL